MFPIESFSTASCPSEFGVDRIKMCEAADLEIQLKDRNGCVIPIEPDYTGNYRIREMYWSTGTKDFTVTVLNAEEGLVSIHVDCCEVCYPGIYLAELSFQDADDCTRVSMFRYLEVAPTLSYTSQGAISIPEIRLVLRDDCAADNTLLDDYEFSDIEIIHSIRRPVDLWNETTPNVALYSPQTFPWREHWLICTTGYLLRIAAHHYRRNNLTYQAAGVAINDKDKFNQYDQVAELRINEYKMWMQSKKIEINISQGFGTLSSGYGHGRVY